MTAGQIVRTANEPLELARRLHDTVAQRLAALSYLLAASELSPDAIDLCRAEVHAALDELRDALTSVGSATPRDARAEALAELRLLRDECPEASLALSFDDLIDTDPPSLVFAFLREGLRNVRKHAAPRSVTVSVLRNAEVISIEISNDGVTDRPGPSCGAGRRLLELEASLHGGLVECAPGDAGRWFQRLILPAAELQTV